MGSIYYECKDLLEPAGGVQRIYRHVQILNKNGIRAAVMHHQKGFRLPWMTTAVPLSYWTDAFRFRQNDILVIPEGHVRVMRESRALQCRKVGLCLGWGNVFRNLALGEDWRTFAFEAVIAGSDYDRKFLFETMGIQSTVIVSGIDTDMFASATTKTLEIAYMTKKDNLYSHLILAAFRSMFPEHSDVPFSSLSGLPHSLVAERLSRTSIFLSQTFPEGLSRKILEAMASEAIVVAFPGHGSSEFLENTVNCYTAPDGDILVAAKQLGRAVSLVKEGKDEPMRVAARLSAKRYSLAREEDTVLSFWRKFLRGRVSEEVLLDAGGHV